MKTETFKGTIKTASGKALDAPLSYEGSAEVYSDASELRSAGKWPTDDEIVAFVNTEIVNSARSAKVQSVLAEAGFAKVGKRLSDPSYRFTNLVKTLIAAGKTPAEAESAAKMLLG